MICHLVLKTTRKNSVSSGWTENYGIEAGAGLEADIGFKIQLSASVINIGSIDSLINFHPKFDFRGKVEYGISNITEETVEIGTDLGTTTKVDPQKTIIDNLISEKLTLKVKVKYEASIYGTAMLYFEK